MRSDRVQLFLRSASRDAAAVPGAHEHQPEDERCQSHRRHQKVSPAADRGGNEPDQPARIAECAQMKPAIAVVESMRALVEARRGEKDKEYAAADKLVGLGQRRAQACNEMTRRMVLRRSWQCVCCGDIE